MMNLQNIAQDKALLAIAQRKVRAGEKLNRSETAALRIEADRLQDEAIARR